MSLVGNKLGGKERDAYDFMRFESNSTLKMYEKESMPEADKPCQLKPENDPSSLYRASVSVKTSPDKSPRVTASNHASLPCCLYQIRPTLLK